MMDELCSIPVLTRENAPADILFSVYDRLCRVSDMLREKYSDMAEALWYLKQRDCDGRIQVVLKTLRPLDTMERLYIHADISRALGDAQVYEYDSELYDSSMLNSSNAYAVYPHITAYIRGRVQAVVVREKKLLLVKHCVDGEEYWILPGGGIERGENPEQGALRELREECGAEGRIICKLSEYSDEYLSHSRCTYWTYLVDIGSAEPTLGYDPEFSEGEQILREAAWKSLDELSERDRAHLWSAGIIGIPQFRNELYTWSRDIIPPKRK